MAMSARMRYRVEYKTSDLIAAVATVLPGSHTDDNAAIVSGKLIETTTGTAGIELDVATISTTAVGTDRLQANVIGASQSGVEGFGGLILEASQN